MQRDIQVYSPQIVNMNISSKFTFVGKLCHWPSHEWNGYSTSFYFQNQILKCNFNWIVN
jgi:hypothetical protein